MADLSTTLELEFRLLESHIIKKKIREFRKKRPDTVSYTHLTLPTTPYV